METVSGRMEMHERSGEEIGCAKKLCRREDSTRINAHGLVDVTQSSRTARNKDRRGRASLEGNGQGREEGEAGGKGGEEE